jgi:hypothetical protein
MTMRYVLRSMKLFRFQLRFALLLTALACADATVPEPFHLRIEPMRTRYAPGDFVEVTIRDAGARGVTYNTCASNLQQFDRGAWRPTRSFEDGGFVCDDALHSLPSGTEAIGTAGASERGHPRRNLSLSDRWYFRTGRGSGAHRRKSERSVPGHSSMNSARAARRSMPFARRDWKN